MSDQQQDVAAGTTKGKELIAPDLAAEQQDDENDWASVGGTDTTSSISSSVLAFRKLHGRTYQNYEGAEYWGPNDERQNQGLDVAHHMMYLAFDNKLHLAPLKDPQNVLDLGTGTGIWAIDFADEYPESYVLGTDLSPIQPTWLPPNCKFEIDNCEQAWIYPDNHFDYVHIRGLVGCIQDWPKLYREALRVLKPGGWLEQQEYALPLLANSGALPPDSVYHDWGAIFVEAGKKSGRSFLVADHWEEWLKEAGFTGEIHRNSVNLPIGSWARDKKWKEVGQLNFIALDQGLEGFASFLCTQVLGWTPEEVASFLEKVRKAMRDRNSHVHFALRTVWTQKPAAA